MKAAKVKTKLKRGHYYTKVYVSVWQNGKELEQFNVSAVESNRKEADWTKAIETIKWFLAYQSAMYDIKLTNLASLDRLLVKLTLPLETHQADIAPEAPPT